MKQFIEDQDDDDKDYENNDAINCEICYEKFSIEKMPMILKCSHTICKNCLNGLLKKENPKCPNCNMIIEKNQNENNTNNILWENKIILNLIDLCNFLNTDVNSILSFPLNFKFCENCDFFITNYSFISHKSLNHKFLNLNKKLRIFFENDLNKSNISLDDNNYIIVLLYYYKSSFLPKFKYFEVKKSFNIGNSKFKFYGQIVNDKIFSSNLIKNSEDKKKVKLHKGVLINKEKGLLIHGYFFIKIQESKLLISKILGLLSYEDIRFYGFIKINKNNNNNEDLSFEDFILEYGLLFDKKYYFGVFNEEYMKKYFLDGNNNSNETVLKKGEIISLKDDGVEVEEIKGNSSLNKLIKLNNNRNNIRANEEKKEEEKNISQKNSLIYDIQIEKTSIIIKKSKESKEYISIEPLSKTTENIKNNLEYFHLYECKFYLSNYNKELFNFLIQIKEKSVIIIDYFKGTLKNNINYQEGYLIDFNQNQSEPLNTLYCLSLKDIADNVYYFAENLYKLLKTEIKYCKMKYCYFQNINNSFVEIDKKYFEINPYFIKEIKTNKSSTSEKIYRESDVLNKATIEDLLNGLLQDIVKFDEKDFNDEKSKNEGCLTI